MYMLNNAKAVLSKRIEQMPEEGLLLLLEETFPYVSCVLYTHKHKSLVSRKHSHRLHIKLVSCHGAH